MIRVILTDIEGTTSSISFVHEVLFPYASEHLPAFVRAHHHTTPAVAEQLAIVAQKSGVDSKDVDALIEVLQNWIREDRKEGSLKALQGMVWEQGYHSGELKGHIYPDARSEEHTSELQSRPHLVCRLLLEKKKQKYIHKKIYC